MNFFQANPEYAIDNTFPIQPAGTKHGPCDSQNCGHVRCEGKRRIVYSRCAVCHKIIGFGNSFSIEGTSFNDLTINHAACVKVKALGSGVTIQTATPRRVAAPKPVTRQLAAPKKALPAPRRTR